MSDEVQGTMPVDNLSFGGCDISTYQAILKVIQSDKLKGEIVFKFKNS